MDFKSCIFFVCFITVALPSFAQSVIEGAVTNAKTGKPLPRANVYFAQTTLGSSTNKLGQYEIQTNLKGKFNLVFSYVGFKKKIVAVVLNNKTVVINAALKPVTIQLEEFAVSASNEQWEERFNFFRDEFIGTTRSAIQTKILNPEVLRFDINSDGKFVAKSIKPLLIINYALGYKIYIELVQFKFDRDGIKGFYTIYPKFTPLVTASKKQQKRWQQNRREAYLGSLRQFLKKLYHDDWKSDFSILPRGTIEPVADSLAVLDKIRLDYKAFKLSRTVSVSYGHFSNQVKSVLAPGPNSRVHTFYINKNGILYNPLAIALGGFWGYTRVADLLPLDFLLPNDR